MSTAATTIAAPSRPRFSTTIATRFAWKEYRALRGLWLAVLVLGVLMQAIVYKFTTSALAIDWATVFFMIALGSTALYAVGVASTTFSMEHEEETYGYIAGLPANWLPIFAGKMFFALASAVALACALSLAGWIGSGFDTPGGRDALFALGVGGFAIVEAIAWGTLFSLLLRQPLLAALLAMATLSITLTLAANAFGMGALPATRIETYFAILPQRAVMAFVVLSLDLLLARRWFTADTRPASVASAGLGVSFIPTNAANFVDRFRTGARSFAARHASLRVFAHLLWQTYRQSWAILLATVASVVFVCAALVIVTHPTSQPVDFNAKHNASLWFGATMLVAALYACTVFYADQRNHKYRFLAEHAAWPRFVWLTRLLVWLVPIFIATCIAAALLANSAYQMLDYWRDSVRWMFRGTAYWDANYTSQQLSEANAVVQACLLALWSAAVGFALGQACSMFFRRALVAGLAAGVFCVPIQVWCIAIWVWELPYAIFLTPIIFGLLLATWVRVKDWIVERNSFVSWLKVGAAIVIPILPLIWLLPAVRLHQIQSCIFTTNNLPANFRNDAYYHEPQKLDVPNIVADWLARYKSEQAPAESVTADRIVRLAESIHEPANNGVDGSAPAIPRDSVRMVRTNSALIREATELSRQAYRFPALAAPDGSSKTYDHLTDLVNLLLDAGMVAIEDGELDAALQHILAAIQLSERIDSGRPTFRSSNFASKDWIPQSLISWASAKGQTSARVKRAIVELDPIFPPIEFAPQGVPTADDVANWTPPRTLMADYALLRDILLGKEPSQRLSQDASPAEYAAVLANELSFERERALLVLDYITLDRAARYQDVAWRLNQRLLHDITNDSEKRWGEHGIENIARDLGFLHDQVGNFDISSESFESLPYSWVRTTPLLNDELSYFAPYVETLDRAINTQVAGWGLRQQLALIAYRLDHGRYPDSLAKLVPDYLQSLPFDPYTGRPFEYLPKGVPLRLEYFNGTSASLIPNTPFLWSVGARMGYLREVTSYEAVDPAADPASEADETREKYMEFELRPSYWGYGSPQVFPLPKEPSTSAPAATTP